MKKLLLTIVLLVVCLTVCSCVSVRFNPETKEITYTRSGDQEIGGFYFSADPNGAIHVELEKQQSNIYQSAMELAEKMFLAGIAAGQINP